MKQSSECCMCGDHGVPSELFQCKICQFRSQHRYCSNVYPKAEAYQLCNWCLNKDEKSQNSSNSSSSNSGDLKTKRKTHTLKHSLPIKKQLSPPPKRLVTRSDASKPVFRNKVRRYKLLDEVSS